MCIMLGPTYRVVVRRNGQRLVISHHASRESAELTAGLISDSTVSIEGVRKGATRGPRAKRKK